MSCTFFSSFPEKTLQSKEYQTLQKEEKSLNDFHVQCVGSLPSTIAKFLNPMASNLCLTISDTSDI